MEQTFSSKSVQFLKRLKELLGWFLEPGFYFFLNIRRNLIEAQVLYLSIRKGDFEARLVIQQYWNTLIDL